jgi:hypothetical protein
MFSLISVHFVLKQALSFVSVKENKLLFPGHVYAQANMFFTVHAVFISLT